MKTFIIKAYPDFINTSNGNLDFCILYYSEGVHRVFQEYINSFNKCKNHTSPYFNSDVFDSLIDWDYSANHLRLTFHENDSEVYFTSKQHINEMKHDITVMQGILSVQPGIIYKKCISVHISKQGVCWSCNPGRQYNNTIIPIRTPPYKKDDQLVKTKLITWKQLQEL